MASYGRYGESIAEAMQAEQIERITDIKNSFLGVMRELARKDLLHDEVLMELSVILGDEGMMRITNLGKPILLEEVAKRFDEYEIESTKQRENFEGEMKQWGWRKD